MDLRLHHMADLNREAEPSETTTFEAFLRDVKTKLPASLASWHRHLSILLSACSSCSGIGSRNFGSAFISLLTHRCVAAKATQVGSSGYPHLTRPSLQQDRSLGILIREDRASSQTGLSASSFYKTQPPARLGSGLCCR